MNQQLRTLASQSGIDVYGLGKDRVKWEHCVEQFSELIVQECIQQASNEAERFYNMGEDNLAAAMLNYQELLKQQFGIAK